MEQSMWIRVDGEPPELIIVYYSAGADVNIHTTGHFPLSICARVHIGAANGVRGSGSAFFIFYFLSKREGMSHVRITIWKLACIAAPPKPPGDTKDYYSAMQIGNLRECPTSLLAGWIRVQEHSSSMYQMFIYLPDWTRWGCPPGGLCKLSPW